MKFILFDRIRKAGDNAEYFYRFLALKHKEIKIFYVLDKDSYDWPRLKKEGFNLIDSKDAVTLKREIYSADAICFSYFTKTLATYVKYSPAKRIFLNHGCFYRILSYLKNHSTDFDLMLAGNKFERSVLLNKYKFPPSKIALTGQPRQDSLILNNKKYQGKTNNILIQFWWRPWLNKETFEKSIFYKQVSLLLQDKRITELANKYNVNFLFKLHCEMEKYINLFKKFNQVQLIPNEELFEPLFIKSKLLVTDMTSNVYEIGMINKPCLYFEPDWEDLKQHLLNSDGDYLDVFKDGIGPVASTIDEFFIELEKLLKNSYKLDDKYNKRRNEQIVFAQDPRCCERSLCAILKIVNTKKPVLQKSTIGSRANTYLYF